MDDIFEKYNTGKAIKLKDGRIIPILDIPMMSDEEWERLNRGRGSREEYIAKRQDTAGGVGNVF